MGLISLFSFSAFFLFSSNLLFLSFPCKFIHKPSASSNNAATSFSPAISFPFLYKFLSSFSLCTILSPTFNVKFLTHSKLILAFVVSFITVSAFLYESVIGTVSTIFSIKFSDIFPSVFMCIFSSSRNNLFFIPASSTSYIALLYSTSPIIVFIVFFLSPLCLYFLVSLSFISFLSYFSNMNFKIKHPKLHTNLKIFFSKLLNFISSFVTISSNIDIFLSFVLLSIHIVLEYLCFFNISFKKFSRQFYIFAY